MNIKHQIASFLFLLYSLSVFSNTCDTLVLQNGTEILIEEIEINHSVIVYKKCGDLEKGFKIDRDIFLRVKKYQAPVIQPSVPPSSFNPRDSSLITLNLDDDTILKKMMLHKFGDSSIIVSSNQFPEQQSIPIKSIRHINIYKKGKVKRATIAGAGIGGFTGLLLGLGVKKLSNSDEKEGTISIPEPLGAGFVILMTSAGAIEGGLIGLAVGSINFKLPINGKQKKYEKIKNQFRY